MGDTFGFSVLEMQACGCPVITTDRRALSEINNDQCGWLIKTDDLQLPHGDDFAHYTRKEVETFSDSIRRNLAETGTVVLGNRNQLQEKAEKSLERIRNYHNPEEYEKRLYSIYQRAIGDKCHC